MWIACRLLGKPSTEALLGRLNLTLQMGQVTRFSRSRPIPYGMERDRYNVVIHILYV